MWNTLQMMTTCKHLIFFDSSCSLCIRSVKKILSLDLKDIFCFAPLNGVTANSFMQKDKSFLQGENSLILVENYQKYSEKIWLRSKAIFRILWLSSSFWKIIGALYILPAFVLDGVYNLIARHRHLVCMKRETFPNTKKFLP